MLTDWWDYCWMILAENRAAAIDEKYLASPNVIGVIVGQ